MTPLLSNVLLRTQTNARLVALAAEGHEVAFQAIVERYRKPLLRYCGRIPLSPERAEDAVQQTFLNAWTALRDGYDVRDLRAWLYRIAHNVALNIVRKAGYDYAELAESLRGAESPGADPERRAVMRETLVGVAALPERQREALLRTAVDGISQQQVARELGVTEGAVRQLVHRARSTLRTAATAITPFPIASWAAGGARRGDELARIGEIVGGGGAAAGAATAAKLGAVVLTAGALAVTPVTHVLQRSHGQHRGDAQAAVAGPDSGAEPRSNDQVVAPLVHRSHGSPGRRHGDGGRGASRGDSSERDRSDHGDRLEESGSHSSHEGSGLTGSGDSDGDGGGAGPSGDSTPSGSDDGHEVSSGSPDVSSSSSGPGSGDSSLVPSGSDSLTSGYDGSDD